ncbi:MAG: site-2 protease family protein [Chloroflexi bacterium]|nr:site-2 protease family protein [Chloroflexota bacterium]
MISFLWFIPIIVVLILAHELGHFVTAKLAHVQVKEFGLGFPPRLVAKRWGETEYSLNLVPLGGFVKMAGEEDPDEPRSLSSQPRLVRLLVLSAGSLMNAFLPVLLLTAMFMIPQTVTTGQVSVSTVAPGSPAESAGIRPGDIILQVNGKRVTNTSEVIYQINLRLGAETTMLLRRGRFNQELVTVVPRWNPPKGQGPTGIQVGMVNAYPTRQSYPIWQAFPKGVHATWDLMVLTRNQLTSLFIKRSLPEVTGPIGIAQVTGEVAKVGIGPLLNLAALLSLNLAIINLLPVPMLDGGRVLFLAIEVVRGGRRLSPRREALAHFIGLMAILALVALVSYFDVIRIVRGDSLLK